MFVILLKLILLHSHMRILPRKMIIQIIQNVSFKVLIVLLRLQNKKCKLK